MSEVKYFDLVDALAVIAAEINRRHTMKSTLRIAVCTLGVGEFVAQTLHAHGVPVLPYVLIKGVEPDQAQELWCAPMGCQLPVGCATGCQTKHAPGALQPLACALSLAADLASKA